MNALPPHPAATQPVRQDAPARVESTLPLLPLLADLPDRHRPTMDGDRGRSGPVSAKADALLVGLNEQQRQAVTHNGGPLLIVAGAGSGKTRVLTHRIAYLLATGRARPGQILAITFTNKAAAEMRERVADLVGPSAQGMWVSTFHSACVRILRREATSIGLRSSFSIYDAADSLRLMTLVARQLDIDIKRFPPKALLGRVSSLKNELVDEDAFASTVAPDAKSFDAVLAAAYRGYQERLRQAHALDFDDLIMSTVQMLQAFPLIAEGYRRRFRHILVDEYQDTNHAQYVLIRELVGSARRPATSSNGADEADALTDAISDGGAGPSVPPGELTVVGDADQSIYAFRGATLRNIVEFEADHPDATTVVLEQNYRSTQTILSAANAVIAKNPGRHPKRLWTDSGQGVQIVGYVADDEYDEARFVAEEIDRLSDEHGVRPGDVAVFYRTNAQSRALEEVLVRVGLPYKVVGGTRFYERKEIKDAIAYLRAIVNPDDAVNVRRIINVPKRGIGDRAEALIAEFAERERISFGAALERVDEIYGMATRSANAVKGFASLMAQLRAVAAGEGNEDDAREGDADARDDAKQDEPDGAEVQPVGAAVVLEAVLTRTGYLDELRASSDPQDEVRVENLHELLAVAQEFQHNAPEGDLADFLERVSLVADSDQIPSDDDADRGVVTLMTLHTAKGLEFPVVFVTGMEDGTFPHQRSMADEGELQEERRLAYVGLTRARERLYLSRAALRSAWGQPMEFPASRFLDDIPPELVDWRRLAEDRMTWFSGRRTSRPRKENATQGASTGATFGSATPRPAGQIPNLAVGDKVTHDAYGLGTVVAVQGGGPHAVATVDFGSGGEKRLLLRYSPVTKL